VDELTKQVFGGQFRIELSAVTDDREGLQRRLAGIAGVQEMYVVVAILSCLFTICYLMFSWAVVAGGDKIVTAEQNINTVGG
jgi:hypothetical protein